MKQLLRQGANLLLARRPSFVITGTGRCGTAYAARRLSDLGIECSHEAFFTPTGPRLRNPTRHYATMGDASWFAPPFISQDELPVVHLVRRPEDVVYSLFSIGFFDPVHRAYHRPFFDFAARYFEIGDNPFDACVRWYIEWNSLCDRIASVRVRIEDLEAGLPKIFATIGIAPLRDAPRPTTTYNKRPSIYSNPPDRVEFEQRIWMHPQAPELAAMAARFGYVPAQCAA